MTIASILVAMSVCVTGFTSNPCYADAFPETSQQKNFKNTCLAATIKAIELEIGRYRSWIDLRKNKKIDQKDLPALEDALSRLESDLKKYQQMTVADYNLPDKITTKAWVESKAADNSILYVHGMSRSGPWYHLAGIAGGDYTILRPGVLREVVFYEVYPRNYWNMSSMYVCVTEVR